MSGLFHTFYRILDNTNPQQKNIIKSAGEEEEDEEKEDQDYRPEESEEESEDDTNEDPQLYEEIFHLQTETSQIDNNDNITTFISLANTGRMITRQMRRELEAESLGITSSLIQQLFGRSRNCSSRYTDNQGVSEDIRLRQLAAIISVSKREKLVNSQTRSRSSPITTATAMTEVLLAANIGNAITSNNIERQSCVVCRVESRQVVLRPCGCLCLCDACREELAVRRFQDCPCCRRKVEGIRRRGDENRGGAQPKLFPII